MKNFKDYEALIRKTVQEINDEDPNWDWTVKSLGKYNVRIRWSYLDYLGEDENCFSITLREEEDEMFLVSRRPHGKMINGHILSKTEERTDLFQELWDNAIVSAITEIAHYAHNVY